MSDKEKVAWLSAMVTILGVCVFMWTGVGFLSAGRAQITMPMSIIAASTTGLYLLVLSWRFAYLKGAE